MVITLFSYNRNSCQIDFTLSKLLFVQQQQDAKQQQQPAAALTVRYDEVEVNLIIFIKE